MDCAVSSLTDLTVLGGHGDLRDESAEVATQRRVVRPVLMSTQEGEIPVVTLLDGGMGFELKLRGVKVPSHTESSGAVRALI